MTRVEAFTPDGTLFVASSQPDGTFQFLLENETPENGTWTLQASCDDERCWDLIDALVGHLAPRSALADFFAAVLRGEREARVGWRDAADDDPAHESDAEHAWDRLTGYAR